MLRRVVNHVLQEEHQLKEALRAKIAQLGQRLLAVNLVLKEHIVVIAIQQLNVWSVQLVSTTLKQIKPAAYRVFLESTKTKQDSQNASSALVERTVV